MAHKTFTCSICGEIVTKPQSYALQDGSRACRKHQEAQEARQTIMKTETEKREQQNRRFRLQNKRR